MNRKRVMIIGLLVLALLGVVIPLLAKGRGDIDDVVKKPAKDITADEAIAACRLFYKKAGLREPDQIPHANRSTDTVSKSEVFHVSFENEALCFVDIKTGQVVLYMKTRHPDNRSGSVSPKPLGRPMRGAEMDDFIKKLASNLNIPSRYRMRDRSGYGTAMFEIMPYGYRVHQLIDYYSLTIDPVSRELIRFRKSESRRYVIESHEAKIDSKTAMEFSQKIVERVGPPNFYAKGSEQGNPSSQLKLVCPNGLYEGVRYNSEAPEPRLRLAWIISYPSPPSRWSAPDPQQTIWIDAADGRVLGGTGADLYKIDRAGPLGQHKRPDEAVK